MKNNSSQSWKPIDTLVSALVFVFLLFGVYGLLFASSYTGFYYNPSTAKVVEIYERGADSNLRVGDVIRQVGQITFKDFKRNKLQSLFEDAQPGKVYDIIIERDGHEITLQWIYPGFSEAEFSARFFNTWWLSFLFWGFGLFTQKYIHPRDLTWKLLVAVNYLLAIFISLGNFSAFHTLGSAVLMRVAAWMLAPVFIQLHWYFPSPLRNISRRAWNVFYLIFIALAAAEFTPLLPTSFYYLGLLLAFIGSITLMVVHYVRQPAYRSDIRLLGIILVLTLLPIISVSFSAFNGNLPSTGPLALFTLVMMPMSYIYAINRRRMGNMELRASRVVAILMYLALVSSALPFVVPTLSKSFSQNSMVVFSFLLSLAATFLTVFLFPPFQSWVEQHILGITLPYKKILETYSNSINSSATLNDLLMLLKQNIFNSLQVQQYAFILKADGTDKILLSKNVDEGQLQVEAALALLDAGRDHRLIPPSDGIGPLGWIRLILPLKVDSNTIGVWLLGRRDPDDLYPQADLPIIQSLASQTAIALSNIQQTDRLKAMYQANVDRYEQERLRLALDLHDSVLNELAALLMILDPAAQTPQFRSSYETVSQRLREIVTELRPPMLNFGFKFALEDLADNLSERNKDAVQIDVTVKGEESIRYAQSVEHYIYRMVQEACENAIRHGQARHIRISGELAAACIDLLVEDDGKGFDASHSMQLDHLVVNKHFGLAGMIERAMLIGAKVSVASAPGQGTQVAIHWEPSV